MKNSYKLTAIASLLLGGVFLGNCSAPKPELSNPSTACDSSAQTDATLIGFQLLATEEEATWEGEVKTILATSCAGSTCHGAGADQQTSYDTTDAAQSAFAASGAMALIESSDENARMPKGRDPMSTEDIDVLKLWIENGYPKGDTAQEVTDDTEITYYDQIEPWIKRNSCLQCHDTGGSKPIMTSYTEIKAEGQKHLDSLSGANGVQLMPKGGEALAATEIDMFKKWVDGGMLEGTKVDAPEVTGTSVEYFKDHVLKIVSTVCLACHDDGGQVPTLNTRNLIEAKVDKILDSIGGKSGAPVMPPADHETQLTASEKKTWENWGIALKSEQDPTSGSEACKPSTTTDAEETQKKPEDTTQ